MSLWGIAWRSRDIELTRHRLTDTKVTASSIRVGRKPGTRVMTVDDPALATKTLIIELTERETP